MRKKERELYEQLINSVCENSEKFPESKLTAFAGIQGIKYDESLMVIGRAVNRWTNSWSPAEMNGQYLCESIISNAYKDGEDKCPLI